MLGDLLAWFMGTRPNRRKYPRKRKPFRAAVSFDGGVTHKPAIGLDISGGGICVLTQEPIGVPEFEIRASLGSRVVRVRAKTVWHDTVAHQGKSVWRYGMSFSGVSADDWDAIVRYCGDKPVVEENKAQEDLAAVRMTPDDASRLLPTQLQQRLLRMLVDRRRLAPMQDNVTPLVQYFYAGAFQQDGRRMHRLTIQSKVVGPEGSELFDTRFMFDDKGESVQILN